LKPKRVSFEEETYTVEVEMKRFTAVVRVDVGNREIRNTKFNLRAKKDPPFQFLPKSF